MPLSQAELAAMQAISRELPKMTAALDRVADHLETLIELERERQ